jgi:osmotically-inducible protein OsmY
LTPSTTAFGLGFATAFFFDPRSGAGRRSVLRDRVLRLVRRARRLARRKSRYYAGKAHGVAAEARSAVVEPSAATDDATVRQRILSDALRAARVSTSDVEVDVRGGVATLRGSIASRELVDDLVEQVRKVPGVREVSPQLTVSAPTP